MIDSLGRIHSDTKVSRLAKMPTRLGVRDLALDQGSACYYHYAVDRYVFVDLKYNRISLGRRFTRDGISRYRRDLGSVGDDDILIRRGCGEGEDRRPNTETQDNQQARKLFHQELLSSWF